MRARLMRNGSRPPHLATPPDAQRGRPEHRGDHDVADLHAQAVAPSGIELVSSARKLETDSNPPIRLRASAGGPAYPAEREPVRART